MLRIERGNGSPELYLYADIVSKGDWFYNPDNSVSKEDVLDALAAVTGEKEIVLRIASQGGDVLEGVAIYQALTRFPGRVRVEVDSLAASISSVIAMAGDEIVMAGNAWLMVHWAWSRIEGNKTALRQFADTLEKIDASILDTYATRVGDKATREQLTAWLDGETWLTAQQAVDAGFADRVAPLKAGAPQASVQPGRFENCPQSLIAATGGAASPPAPSDRREPAGRLAIAARVAAARRRAKL